MSVNIAIVVGNLGRDPEVRFSQSGRPIATLSVATNEVWNDQEGNRQERTEWHRVVVFGKTAETCGQYLAKGRQVCVQGRIQTRKWTDQNGQDRYTTEIVAQRVQFLGGGGGARASQEPHDQGFGESSSSFQSPPIDDDIPF